MVFFLYFPGETPNRSADTKQAKSDDVAQTNGIIADIGVGNTEQSEGRYYSILSLPFSISSPYSPILNAAETATLELTAAIKKSNETSKYLAAATTFAKNNTHEQPAGLYTFSTCFIFFLFLYKWIFLWF